MKEEEPLYVGVEEPIEVRKNLLETSKEIIQNLQGYEKIKMIREKKINEIQKLKKILREINSLNSRLKQVMPGKNMKAAKEKVKKAEKEKPKSELKKLEKELSQVEKELSKLE